MLKVGLTGNIGSGKSTVAEIFETLGLPVYHADEESKKFLDDPAVINELIKHFGYGILSNDQFIQKRALASLVFSDPAALKLLTSILHPRVIRDFGEWIKTYETLPYIIQEAAIIFENGLQKGYDKIIHVACPPEEAIERVIRRDQMNRTEVLRRLQFQMNEEEKAAMADYVIQNNGSELVIPQVLALHKLFTGHP